MPVYMSINENMSDRSPTPYSPTQKHEYLANTTLESLLNAEKLVPHIAKEDKRPNIDGEIVLVNEKRAPLCKVEVQIKKLPDKNTKNPRISCPISLFEYAKITLQPLIFITVDISNNVAYWIQIDDLLYEKIIKKIKKHQKKTTLSFPLENKITKSETIYIDQWSKICQNQINKLKRYDNLVHQYAILKEHSNPILGVSKNEFGEIHFFLDELNQIIDEKFSIIKKTYFPNSWKIGIAYFEYSNSNLVYSLYPIPINKNDVQIKEIDDHLKTRLMAEHLDITGHYRENPIKLHPKQYVIEVCKSRILRILKNRLLDHKNEFLAREYTIAFVDEFNIQMGIEIKNRYSIDELNYAFFQYLPTWINEALIYHKGANGQSKYSFTNFVFRNFYYDPNSILNITMPDSRIIIDKQVRDKLKNHTSIPNIMMGNEKYPFGIFYELFTFMKSLGVKEIRRVYSPKDYERLIKNRSGWIWDTYSSEQLKYNLSVFFENLNQVYLCLIEQNFPEIKTELKIFGQANRIVVLFTVHERYDMNHSPTIEIYYLVDKSINSIVFEVYNREEVPEIPTFAYWAKNYENGFLINGKRYSLISLSQRTLDFIFDDTPMLDYCYELLETNLKRYFENIKDDSSVN